MAENESNTTDLLFGSCYDTVRAWVRSEPDSLSVNTIVGFTTRVMAVVQRQIRGDGARKKALVLAVLRKVIECDVPLEEADKAALVALLAPGGLVCVAIDALVSAARGILGKRMAGGGCTLS